MEAKIFRKSLLVALNLFVQPFRRYAVKRGKVGVEDDSLPSQADDRLLGLRPDLSLD